MSIISEIRESWSWVGIEPSEIVRENHFGNLLIKDFQNRIWRLCPEDVYCEIVAESDEELNELLHSPEFKSDWDMKALVGQATQKLGALKDGYKYYLVVPGVLGGEYAASNIKAAPLAEIVRLSGHIGKQIRDLPDGAEIQLKVVD